MSDTVVFCMQLGTLNEDMRHAGDKANPGAHSALCYVSARHKHLAYDPSTEKVHKQNSPQGWAGTS